MQHMLQYPTCTLSWAAEDKKSQGKKIVFIFQLLNNKIKITVT